MTSAEFCKRFQEISASLPHNPTQSQIDEMDAAQKKLLQRAQAELLPRVLAGDLTAIKTWKEIGDCAANEGPIVVDYGLEYAAGADPDVCSYWTAEALDALSPENRDVLVRQCGFIGYTPPPSGGGRNPAAGGAGAGAGGGRRPAPGAQIGSRGDSSSPAAPDNSSPNAGPLLLGAAIVAGVIFLVTR